MFRELRSRLTRWFDRLIVLLSQDAQAVAYGGRVMSVHLAFSSTASRYLVEFELHRRFRSTQVVIQR